MSAADLARRLSLTTADKVTAPRGRLPAREARGAKLQWPTGRIPPDLQRVIDELAYAAVAIIGTDRRVPRSFGDNEGHWPIRTVVAGDLATAARPYDQGGHTFPVVVHRAVYTRSDAHGRKVKGALDEMLFGRGAAELRKGWRDCEPWIAELLLVDAVAAAGVDAFDGDERRTRILRRWVEKAGVG